MSGNRPLRRIDPDRNRARFYTMSGQPALFGEWALLREWGRIGSAGRLMSGRFASGQEAALAMAEPLKAKLRKGYVQGAPASCRSSRLPCALFVRVSVCQRTNLEVPPRARPSLVRPLAPPG
jgi:predicted DNA-binding WGR domain protein